MLCPLPQVRTFNPACCLSRRSGPGALVVPAAVALVCWVSPGRGQDARAAEPLPALYVDVNATGPTHDGQSWCTAFVELQHALAAAAELGEPVEIRIADGVYRPDLGTGDRQSTFNLTSGLALRGGYAGCGAAAPNERDFDLYVTTLDGDLLGNDGPDFVNFEDNAMHVVSAIDLAGDVTLEGLAIRGGNCNGRVDGSGCGVRAAAVRIHIDSCRLHDNRVEYVYSPRALWLANGGALDIRSNGRPDAAAFVRNSVVENNFVDNESNTVGAVVQSSNALLVIENTSIRENRGISPAVAAYEFDSRLEIRASEIIENEGIGVYVEYAESVLIADSCIADNEQGGVYSSEIRTLATILATDFFRNGRSLLSVDGDAVVDSCHFIGKEYGVWLGPGHSYVGNCTFESSRLLYGSALSIDDYGSRSVVEECLFNDNDSPSYGAALHLSGSVLIRNSSFIGNRSDGVGGAVYSSSTLSDDPVRMENCIFEGNHAKHDGGAVYASDLTLRNCRFSVNETFRAGGAVAANRQLDVSGCSFIGNSSPSGGAIHASGRAVIAKSEFVENAADHGGGLYASSTYNPNGEIAVSQSIFRRNLAMEAGGAVKLVEAATSVDSSLLVGNHAGMYGGAIDHELASLVVRGSTIAYNTTAGYGAGVMGGRNLVVDSSILWGNTLVDPGRESFAVESAQVEGGHFAEIAHSIVEGWTGLFGGIANNGLDPLFVAAVGPDGIPGTEDEDYRLQQDSPAVNTGTWLVDQPLDEADLDGHNRVLCGVRDRGAYEWGVGDVNCDGQLGLGDYAAWVTCWSGPAELWPEGTCSALDYEASGTIDLADYGVAQWTMEPAIWSAGHVP